MNGRELLEALSYIDDELLAASDTPPKKASWKRWAALAACLCILVLGTFSFRQIEKLAKTEAAAGQCAPEAMMAMGAEQETYAVEAAEEAPMEPESDGAPRDTNADSSLLNTDEVTSEAAPLRVKVIELTHDGFIAQVIAEEADNLTVSVVLTEDASFPDLEESKEYFITVESAEADGSLWVSHVEPVEVE